MNLAVSAAGPSLLGRLGARARVERATRRDALGGHANVKGRCAELTVGEQLIH